MCSVHWNVKWTNLEKARCCFNVVRIHHCISDVLSTFSVSACLFLVLRVGGKSVSRWAARRIEFRWFVWKFRIVVLDKNLLRNGCYFLFLCMIYILLKLMFIFLYLCDSVLEGVYRYLGRLSCNDVNICCTE